MNKDTAFPTWVKKTHLPHLMEPAELDNADFIKDDKGDLILMSYIGPRPPEQKPMKYLFIVNNENSTSVHPADKYVYQRYAKCKKKPIPCGGCGATKSFERCIGCLHHFGTTDSDWVNKQRPVESLKPAKYYSLD